MFDDFSSLAEKLVAFGDHLVYLPQPQLTVELTDLDVRSANGSAKHHVHNKICHRSQYDPYLQVDL